LAQTGRWLGEVPEAALEDVPKEIPQADIDRWSIESGTPVGRLRHLGPTVRLYETPPRWAHPSRPARLQPARLARPRRVTLALEGPLGALQGSPRRACAPAR
jgi:hypothetical protein